MRRWLAAFSMMVTTVAISTAEPPAEESQAPENPNDIASELQVRDDEAEPWSFALLEKWNEARKRIEKELGYSWSATYHGVGLGGFLADGTPFGSSGDFTIRGIWKPGFRWRENPAELRFRVRHRHAYGGLSASGLGPEIGTTWGVVDGFSDGGLEIPDFYMRYLFKKPNLELRVGQFSIDSQLGGHGLASSKNFFLNQAFASDPAVAYPRFGAGITGLLNFEGGWSLGLGSSTVQGTQTDDQVDLDFGSGSLFTALQVAYDFTDSSDLAHRVQLLTWHSDAAEDAERPAGQGLSLTYERDFDKLGTKGFARFSWSDGGASELDYLLSVGYSQPYHGKDIFGFGVGIGKSSGSDGNVQAAIEGFYRWHVRDNFFLTPDAQIIFGEFDESPDLRFVAGVRFGIIF